MRWAERRARAESAGHRSPAGAVTGRVGCPAGSRVSRAHGGSDRPPAPPDRDGRAATDAAFPSSPRVRTSFWGCSFYPRTTLPHGGRFTGEEAKSQPNTRPIGVQGRSRLLPALRMGRAVGLQPPFAGRQREETAASAVAQGVPTRGPAPERGSSGAGPGRAVPAVGAGGVRTRAVRARVA